MPLRPFLLSLLAAATLMCAGAFAMPAMDISPDLMLQQAADLKVELRLTPNQQTLWQQVTGKVQAILQTRQSRRANLQALLQRNLDDPQKELRPLAARIDQEAELSNTENRQLRELLLTMHDALDDEQRHLAVQFLSDQLQRSADAVPQLPQPAGEPKARPKRRMKSDPGNSGAPPAPM